MVNDITFIQQIEFNVEQSTTGIADNNNYTSAKKSSMSFPAGGDVVYGVAHQHGGGIGSAIYGEVNTGFSDFGYAGFVSNVSLMHFLKKKRLDLYSRTDGLFAHLNLYMGKGTM